MGLFVGRTRMSVWMAAVGAVTNRGVLYLSVLVECSMLRFFFALLVAWC